MEHPEVSEMMDLWVSKAMNDKILLTGEVHRQKWNMFTKLVGIPEDEKLNLSDGWLTRFKDRNGIWKNLNGIFCIIVQNKPHLPINK